MNKRQIKASVASAILGVLSPLAMIAPASAATQTFEARSITDIGKMSASTSWASLTAPVNGDTVVFPSTATYQYIVNDISSLTLAKIIFNGNVTGTSSKSYDIEGNAISLSGGIDAIMTGNGGDHSVSTGVTLTADQTFKTTGSNTLQVGNPMGGILYLGTNNLTLDASGGTITLTGSIAGTGTITKTGTGKVLILGTYDEAETPTVAVNSGEYVSNGGGTAPVTLAGGTLKGTGTVGTVTMTSGTVAPGGSPGVLNTGNLVYTGGAYAVELGGKAAGEFDQTNVTGTVDLGSATDLNISLFGSYAPAINDSFVIINNDGTDAIKGTFKGLADGDKIIGDYTYQVNYNGGDGNDVVLLVTGNPAAPDTGVGTLINSPLATLAAAMATLAVVGAVWFLENKKHKTSKQQR